MKTSKLPSAVILFAITILFSCEEGMNLELPNSQLNGTPAATGMDTQPLITDYSFSGLEGDAISLEIAQRWTSNYRRNNPTDTKAHFFWILNPQTNFGRRGVCRNSDVLCYRR